MLRSRGHRVELLTRESDRIRGQGAYGLLKGGLSTPWNQAAYRCMRRIVAKFKPDVVHVHNFFPMLSPSIFHAVGTATASVMTLHNYRLVCPAAIPMRDGRVCTDCIDRQSSWPAIVHGCYRNSRIATVPLAAMVSLHRRLGTWKNQIDAFIALSDFQKNLMGHAGLPIQNIHVKPNFFPGVLEVIPWQDRKGNVVFVGRLGVEKGVDDLVEAWKLLGKDAPELIIVGDGPLRHQLQSRVDSFNLSNVTFTGHVDSRRAQQLIATSKLVVLPSKCFEGFPMVLCEAFAFGTPSIVSDIGPLPSLVGDGASGQIVEAGNVAQLAEAVKQLWGNQTCLEDMSRRARQCFMHSYSEEVNYESLMEIYQQAMDVNNRRAKAKS